jgi:hypothetical protein
MTTSCSILPLRNACYGQTRIASSINANASKYCLSDQENLRSDGVPELAFLYRYTLTVCSEGQKLAFVGMPGTVTVPTQGHTMDDGSSCAQGGMASAWLTTDFMERRI